MDDKDFEVLGIQIALLAINTKTGLLKIICTFKNTQSRVMTFKSQSLKLLQTMKV